MKDRPASTIPTPFSRSVLIVLLAACPLLSFAQPDLDFATGKALFDKNWVPAPASTGASDGLGPFYAARSCAQCHPGGGRGSRAQTLSLHIDDPVYGKRLQPYAVPGFRPEARFKVAAGSNSAIVLEELRYGPLANPAMSARIAPALYGVGQLAMIPDAVIAAFADPDDGDGDGISGRVNEIRDPGGQARVGRFGWKASRASLDEQAAAALALDLGLANPGMPTVQGDCTAFQADCLALPDGGGLAGLEMNARGVSLLLTYVRGLSAPPGVESATGRGGRGRALFMQIGCAGCHLPGIDTGNGVVSPYTDLLLHDMGPDLADGLAEASAAGSEWRTAPLWGLGRTGGDYLHDGRAGTLEEAIRWHGGEATGAVRAFNALNPGDRDDVIGFLFSL